MFTRHRLVCVLLISILSSACAIQKEALLDCSSVQDKQTHKLKFKVKGDECVEKVVKDDSCDCDAEALVVHRCDTVEWKVTGKKKSVAFDKNDGTPFDWSDQSSNSKIEGVVRADAELKKVYGYTVRTDDGCPLDPMIIVQP